MRTAYGCFCELTVVALPIFACVGLCVSHLSMQKKNLIFIHLHSVVELSLSGIHYTSILWVILLFSDGTHTYLCKAADRRASA